MFIVWLCGRTLKFESKRKHICLLPQVFHYTNEETESRDEKADPKGYKVIECQKKNAGGTDTPLSGGSKIEPAFF